MRRMFYILSVLTGLLLVPVGCIEDDLSGTSPDGGGSVGEFAPIRLSASVVPQGGTEASLTRAVTSIQSTQFDNGETFYAYFATAGVRIGNVVGNNTTYTTDGSGNAAPATQPYFPAAVTSVDVHAYYPSSVTNSTTSFSVLQNQTSTANYKSSDLMYASCAATRSAGAATGSGSLTFSHRMAKIIVIVGGHRTIDISTPQTCTLGTTLSDANTTSDYITVYTDGSSGSVSCAALVVPEAGGFTGEFLQIITDMGTATYSLSSKVLASGSAYTFNITVSAAAIGLTTTITTWTNGGTTTLAVLMLTSVGCIDDRVDDSSQGRVAIGLTISPSAATTRTVSTALQSAQLDNGQTFYAHFPSGTTSLTGTTFTADGSGGTIATVIPYFTLSGTSTDVRAYYPSSVTNTTTTFSVLADQSTDANYRSSDLMFAATTINKAFPTSSGVLTFAHKMAKVKINVTTNGVSVTKVQLRGIKRRVPFTPSSGAVGTAEAIAGETTVTAYSGSTTTDFSCTALVPEQSVNASDVFVAVTTAGNIRLYKMPSTSTLTAGSEYTYNAVVKAAGSISYATTSMTRQISQGAFT